MKLNNLFGYQKPSRKNESIWYKRTNLDFNYQKIQYLNMRLYLRNWRCFNEIEFDIPLKSWVIIDKNGQGKTSLLSALYSVFEKAPWPGTRFNDCLKFETEFWNLEIDPLDWYLTAQKNPTGRLSLKFNQPPFPYQKVESKPRLISYTPDENDWLKMPRAAKLNTLNGLILEIFGDEYKQQLSKLNKLVKAKQQILKNAIDQQNINYNLPLVSSLTREIDQTSTSIRQARIDFLKYIKSSFPNFNKWLEKPKPELNIYLEKANHFGKKDRSEINQIDSSWFDSITQTKTEQLWQKEYASGRLLFGSQRDDFELSFLHEPATNIFSRGENRLFVLFIKHLIISKLKESDQTVWWLLDDVFNEFDNQREEIIFQEILEKVDMFWATGTKIPNFRVDKYELKDLTLS